MCGKSNELLKLLKTKNSGEVLSKLKSTGLHATSLCTYDFSTLYTTLHHNLIKEEIIIIFF